jgi:hypothetical protein
MRIDAIVGWVERSETHHVSTASRCVNDELQTQFRSRWKLLLHRELDDASIAIAYRAHRRPTERIPSHPHAASIYNRGNCHPPGSSARIWTLPEGDPDYATRWRLIKSAFSRALPVTEQVSSSRFFKTERGIWQRRYWEHTLRDEADFARHVDYIHFNPVKHGYVKRVKDWRYSSFHRMVRLGICPRDWGGDFTDDGTKFGER